MSRLYSVPTEIAKEKNFKRIAVKTPPIMPFMAFTTAGLLLASTYAYGPKAVDSVTTYISNKVTEFSTTYNSEYDRLIQESQLKQANKQTPDTYRYSNTGIRYKGETLSLEDFIKRSGFRTDKTDIKLILSNMPDNQTNRALKTLKNDNCGETDCLTFVQQTSIDAGLDPYYMISKAFGEVGIGKNDRINYTLSSNMDAHGPLQVKGDYITRICKMTIPQVKNHFKDGWNCGMEVAKRIKTKLDEYLLETGMPNDHTDYNTLFTAAWNGGINLNDNGKKSAVSFGAVNGRWTFEYAKEFEETRKLNERRINHQERLSSAESAYLSKSSVVTTKNTTTQQSTKPVALIPQKTPQTPSKTTTHKQEQIASLEEPPKPQPAPLENVISEPLNPVPQAENQASTNLNEMIVFLQCNGSNITYNNQTNLYSGGVRDGINGEGKDSLISLLKQKGCNDQINKL